MAAGPYDNISVDFDKTEVALIIGEEDGAMSVRVHAGSDVPEGAAELPAAQEIVLALARPLLK